MRFLVARRDRDGAHSTAQSEDMMRVLVTPWPSINRRIVRVAILTYGARKSINERLPDVALSSVVPTIKGEARRWQAMQRLRIRLLVRRAKALWKRGIANHPTPVSKTPTRPDRGVRPDELPQNIKVQ